MNERTDDVRTEMRATREALAPCYCWMETRHAHLRGCLRGAALAEVAVFERITEAAREFIRNLDEHECASEGSLVRALADLDRLRGQTEPESERGRQTTSPRPDSGTEATASLPGSACPCDGGDTCVCQ